MRRIHQVLALLLFCFLTTSSASADRLQSQGWFNKLSEEERREVQTDLLLSGFYLALVDAEFGPSTYKAIISFEETYFSVSDGVLIENERRLLSKLSAEAFEVHNFAYYEDPNSGLTIYLPSRSLLGKSATQRGTRFPAPDGWYTIETVRKSFSEQSFNSLFEQLRQKSTNRSVKYSTINDQRFVVTGELDGKFFYLLFYNAHAESIGFSVSWEKQYAKNGSIISSFLASYSAPTKYLQTDPTKEDLKEAQTHTTNNDIVEFGSLFVVSEFPDILALSGPISSSTPLDLRRALNAFPDIETIVLNSPGGSVAGALLIAHEIHDRGISTTVLDESGCYSACAFIFLAGKSRFAAGELGVHQMSADEPDLVSAQTTLSDILEALEDFEVSNEVTSRMLRTPPEEMYVFSENELASLGINTSQ